MKATRLEFPSGESPSAAQRLKYGLRSVGAALVAPGFVVLVLLLGATACAVSGVYLLCGLPWSLIAAAGIAFVLALLMLRGSSDG